jgi:predicted dienelactone hydrolase
MTFERVASDGSPRPLETWIWYPAEGVEGAVAEGAPPVTSGGPYPLVIYSHGSGGRPEYQRFFTEHLASWGYVVAAPPHPGNTSDDCVVCGSEVIVRSAMQRPDDVVFVLGEMLAMRDDASSALGTIIDPERAAIAGHSFGGWTAIYVAPDGRFDAAIAMAPGAPLTLLGQASQIEVPVLILASGKDELINAVQVRSLGDEIPAATPLTYVAFPEGRHLTFVDECFVCSEELPAARGHELTNAYTTAFLQTHLRGDERYGRYLGESVGTEAIAETR